jgi:dienelactone hydrolase
LTIDSETDMPLVMKTALCSLAILLSASALRAEIVEKVVEYTSAGVVCEGVHVVDSAKTGKLPSVLVVHQWTGVSNNEKMRARMLAELGYNVFLADVYGKGIRPPGPPASAKEAGKYKADRPLLRQRVNDALEVMKKLSETDNTKMAAIGYCFGGTAVLELARSGAAVNGVVSFHGGLDSPTPADGKNIKGEVLVLHGADDPFVPPADVKAFEEELTSAGVKYQLVKYPDAVHSFTQKSAGDDPKKGSAYNAEADAKSWVAMKEFFARLFK